MRSSIPVLSPILCFVTLTYSIFFFSYTASPDLCTLSLHDALPICSGAQLGDACQCRVAVEPLIGDQPGSDHGRRDRKSTRLNSSHVAISYAVFCLKKKIVHSPTQRPFASIAALSNGSNKVFRLRGR